MPDGLHIREAANTLHRSVEGRDSAALCGAVACTLAVSGLAAGAPVALKFLIDELSGGHAGGAVLPPVMWLAAYAGAVLGGRLAGEARGILFGAAEQSVIRRLSRTAFGHVISLPMKQHLGRSTGEIIQTLENGLQGFRLVLQHVLFTLLPGLVEIVLIAALMLHFFDGAFLVVFALCAAGYCLVFTDGARRTLRASRAVSSARINANGRLSDGLINFETVKAFSGEARMTELYDKALSETQGRWRQFYRARFANGMMVAFIFASGLAASLWLAMGRVQQGQMTAGDLVLVNAWMLQVVRPLELLGYGLRDIGQGAAFIEKLQGLLREPVEPRLDNCRAASRREEGSVSIQLENVCFAYDPGRTVLDNVSIRIGAGQKVALVGPSGSGKSTLIRLLMKFYEPDAGRILFGGQPLPDIEAGRLREQVVFVSQSPGLFNESILFNAGFPERQPDQDKVVQALTRVGLGYLLNRSTDAPGQLVGEGGTRLSGGEKQRIAVARALLRKPRLILADEPTSALDPASEVAVFGALQAAASGATMIVATHRLATVTDADMILVISEGRIVERGRHDALVAAGGVYAGLWALGRTN